MAVNRPLPSTFFFAFLSMSALGLAACSSDPDSEPTGDGDGDGTGGLSGDGDGDGDGTGGLSGDGDGDGDTSAGPSGTACARDERLGSFVLTLDDDYTTFRGAVSDGVSPGSIPEVIASSGSCDLLGPRNLFCATPCESGSVCAGDDVCVPEAVKASAGLVTVSGLNTDLSVEINGITVDYNKTFQEPYPGFDVDAAISLVAAGDVIEGFTLSGEGVGLLTSSDETVAVNDGESVDLSWDTSGTSANSSIDIQFSVNTHGGTSAWIQCSAEDTGTFSIPADLMQQLIDLGLSGFPRTTLTRYTVDSTEVGAGCVDLTVGSSVTLDIVVDGLVSCDEDDECPDGQTCNDLMYCE